MLGRSLFLFHDVAMLRLASADHIVALPCASYPALLTPNGALER